MAGFFSRLFSRVRTLTLGNLSPYRYSYNDGSKFAGGYGVTELLLTDYWTLRQRSAELFEKNIYARGIVRRLVTNVINTGLFLEASPEEGVLGYPEDGLADWAETTENRFTLWRNSAKLCDQAERKTFGALQAEVFREALVEGDVLVVLRVDQRTQLPRLQLITGGKVRNPLKGSPSDGNKIVHGVEIDSLGRQVAYWVTQDDGTSKRLPAWGEKSGRRLAWLVYGTDKRLDDVRGKPLLSLVLQSLKEIDRYRDSTQRKALVLSMLAMFIQKGEAKPGSRQMTRSGLSGTETTQGQGSEQRTFPTARHMPGLVIEELQHGEEMKAFKVDGTVESFGDFERSIIQGVAWTFEIPPEILMLSFKSNYSASRAANSEFDMYLNRERTDFGDSFCQPIYQEWLLSEVLTKRIDAPGLIDAWRDPAQYDVFAAWMTSDWSGQIKPAIDLAKLVTAQKMMVAEGFTTRARACRELTGQRFRKVAQQLVIENELIAAANRPLALLEASMAPRPTFDTTGEESDDDTKEEVDEDEDEEESEDAEAIAQPVTLLQKAS